MEIERKAEIKKIFEAALFMTPTTIGLNELAKIPHTNVAAARVILNELIHEYSDRDSALEISEDSSGFKMYVREEYEDYVTHLASSPEFHKGIMKTLAYIAFKQPIKQSEVVKYRNVKAYDHIKMLYEKGFIIREKKPPTFILRTTKKFYEYFGKDAIKQKDIKEEIRKAQEARERLASQDREQVPWEK